MRCVAAVRRVRQPFTARGPLAPQTHRCGRQAHLTESRKARLLALLEQRPDATLAELHAPLKRPTSTFDLWLTRLGWSCKKTLHAAEQSRPDVAEQRKQWPQRLADVSADRLGFVDERGANTQMPRRCGRSPIGPRLACPIPHGHSQTTTRTAAVRLQGPRAPWWFGGAMAGELFLAWVKQGLGLCLQPNEVVVRDNLATHKVAGVREAIEGVGPRLEYPPPYSPDFNTIEPRWSKVKQGLKSLAPRNARQLHKAAGAAFATATPADCQGFFYMPATLHGLWMRSNESQTPPRLGGDQRRRTSAPRPCVARGTCPWRSRCNLSAAAVYRPER